MKLNCWSVSFFNVGGRADPDLIAKAPDRLALKAKLWSAHLTMEGDVAISESSDADIISQLKLLNRNIAQLADDVRWLRQREEQKDRALAEAASDLRRAAGGKQTG